jgi:hypothetical protein
MQLAITLLKKGQAVQVVPLHIKKAVKNVQAEALEALVDHKAVKDLLEIQAHKVIRATQAIRALQVLQAPKVIQAIQDQ